VAFKDKCHVVEGWDGVWFLSLLCDDLSAVRLYECMLRSYSQVCEGKKDKSDRSRRKNGGQ
jgi:hypothetical protein